MSSVVDKAPKTKGTAIAAKLVPLFSERKVTYTDGFDEAKKIQIPLPRSKMIQEITIRLVLDVTTGGSAPTYTEDEIHGFIKNIRVLGEGGEVIRHISGTLAHFIEKTIMGSTPENIGLPTATSTTAKGFATFRIFFKTNPRKKDDITALLPAKRFDELILEVETGVIADINLTNPPTVNDADSSIDVDVREVSGAGIFQTNFLEIRDSYKDITLSVAHATFDTDDIQEKVKPVPSDILMHAILATDNSLRDNDIITDLMLKRQSPFTDELFRRDFDRLQQEMRTDYQIATMVTGLLLWEYRKKFGRAFDRRTPIQGLEPNAEDVNIHILNGSPTATSKYSLYTQWVV